MSLYVDIEKRLGAFRLQSKFEVADETLALLGASGCGKSVTLKCIAGIVTPDRGRIVLNGRVLFDSEKRTDLTPQQRRVGYLFQQYALFPNMTVEQNILCGIRAGSRSEKRALAAEKIRMFRLESLEKKHPAQLSGGQQQRVAIARALATSPKILLCDEATSALDPTTTRSILALLKEINRTLGITIIVITHEMAVIEEICQRVAIIDSSRIAEVGAVDDVFTRPQSAMAKQLIYPDGKRRALATGKRYCRIVFDGNSSFEPIVSNMVLECKAPVNIMFADTKNIDGKAYGQMILQLPEDERAAKRALAYLETQNVHTEEVDANAAV